MNIWIEGVDGVGKTTLATALGEALGVTPLYHVTHGQLPKGQRYNVIDRHADITCMIYKSTLPERFCEYPATRLNVHTDNDLYVYLRYSGRKVEDYTTNELSKLELAYSRFFVGTVLFKDTLVQVFDDASSLELMDNVTDPVWQRHILVGDHTILDDPQESLRVKVREILAIIREAERQRGVAYE